MGDGVNLSVVTGRVKRLLAPRCEYTRVLDLPARLGSELATVSWTGLAVHRLLRLGGPGRPRVVVGAMSSGAVEVAGCAGCTGCAGEGAMLSVVGCDGLGAGAGAAGAASGLGAGLNGRSGRTNGDAGLLVEAGGVEGVAAGLGAEVEVAGRLGGSHVTSCCTDSPACEPGRLMVGRGLAISRTGGRLTTPGCCWGCTGCTGCSTEGGVGLAAPGSGEGSVGGCIVSAGSGGISNLYGGGGLGLRCGGGGLRMCGRPVVVGGGPGGPGGGAGGGVGGAMPSTWSS